MAVNTEILTRSRPPGRYVTPLARPAHTRPAERKCPPPAHCPLDGACNTSGERDRVNNTSLPACATASRPAGRCHFTLPTRPAPAGRLNIRVAARRRAGGSIAINQLSQVPCGCSPKARRRPCSRAGNWGYSGAGKFHNLWFFLVRPRTGPC